MVKSFFKVLRPGINTTYQDFGRENLYHIGIPFSGAMDKRNYILSNELTGNKYNSPVIEFAYQGPLLKFYGYKINIAITGNVKFKIISNKKEIDGNCYENYFLENGDQIDIISTYKSVYGYLSISGVLDIDPQWGSYSINTKAEIGPNNGKKFQKNQLINIKKINLKIAKRKLNHFNNKIESIRVIKGTNYNYFSKKSINDFFSKDFIVSKLTDRMGMRIKGPNIKNIKDPNIKSEGLVKGVIQVPPDGNPIIMLSDHGTIGGYPKIATVISADYDKLVQLPPGSKIKFKEIGVNDAEILFKLYEIETKNISSFV